MIQRIVSDTIIGPLMDTSNDNNNSDDDYFGLSSISDYMESHVNTSNDRYLHKISHIKLENDDIVVYSDNVDIMSTSGDITGVTTVTKELFRIHKDEVKELISKLMVEDT